MRKLLYLSSDFCGPRMLQRGSEFLLNYIINYLCARVTAVVLCVCTGGWTQSGVY